MYNSSVDSFAKIIWLLGKIDQVYGLIKERERIKKMMKSGDRVRVINSVIVYHHPQNKKQPFDLKGMEGDITDVIREWQGRPVSANLPIVVQFDKKFKAHFRENELEVI